MNNELSHYGVLGMHWGHRKNQETTSSNRQTKRELKGQKFDKLAANAKTDRKRQIYEREAERARAGKLSRRQRQVIVGASIVAAYATYKMVDSGEAGRLINNGKAFISKQEPNQWKKNELFASKDLDAETAFNGVALSINKQYGQPGTTNNCRRCTFAYIKAREGFDVEATRTLHATGQTNIGLYNAVSGDKHVKGGKLGIYTKVFTEAMSEDKDPHFTNFLNKGIKDINSRIDPGTSAFSRADNIFKALSTQPTNARGELQMIWNNGAGHSMAWEVFNGKPAIFDCQTRQMYDTPEKLYELASHMSEVNYSRLDNIKIDDTMLGRWVKNAKS